MEIGLFSFRIGLKFPVTRMADRDVYKENDVSILVKAATPDWQESGFSHDIPTIVYRSKDDGPEPEEMVTVSVDGYVLDRIGKIMSYLRLGSSGKILRRRRRKRMGKAKGRLHRWDFETEEEGGTYNEQKEAMPKAAFQFGVKMQDGRKTKKQNKDQKITNELHKINKILAKKNMQKGEGNDDSGDESHAGKKPRMS